MEGWESSSISEHLRSFLNNENADDDCDVDLLVIIKTIVRWWGTEEECAIVFCAVEGGGSEMVLCRVVNNIRHTIIIISAQEEEEEEEMDEEFSGLSLGSIIIAVDISPPFLSQLIVIIIGDMAEMLIYL